MTQPLEIAKDHEAQQATTQAQGLIALSDQTQVVSLSTMEAATQLLKEIKDSKNKVEDRRKFLVKPLNDQVRAINEWLKQYVEPLEQAEKLIKQRILDYRQKQEQIRLEEQARLEQQAQEHQERIDKIAAEKGVQAPTIGVPQLNQMATTVKGATERKLWDFEIVDEEVIPREYLVVNESKIRLICKMDKERTNIPGIKAVQKSSLSVRS